MHVLFVTRRAFPTISGMSTYGRSLVEALVRRGHEVTVVAQYRGDAAGRDVYGGGPPDAIEGATVGGLEARGEIDGGDFEADVAALVERCTLIHDQHPFDVIHAQYGFPPGAAAVEVGRRLARPALVSIQGGDGHWVGTCCRHHRSVMQGVLRYSSAAIAGSASFAGQVALANDVPIDLLRVIPGGTDVRRFHPPEAADRTRPVSEILYHGRIDRRKGVFELLAAYRAAHLGSTVRLTFSGIGPDLDDLRDAAAPGPAPTRCLGHVAYDDAPAIYREADLFVSPTYAEGFSNTILEAMATGLPIVSTRTTGVVDCLRDDENALLVPVAEEAALAAAMTRMVSSGELRRRLADRALAEVRERYSWEVVADAFERLYREVAPVAAPDGWADVLPPDPDCRFRRTPHLL